MKIVVDSSVAIKWFVQEPRRVEAMALLGAGYKLSSPGLAYVEVANVLWRKVRMGLISMDQATYALEELPTLVDMRHQTSELMGQALRLAAELGHSVYDCVFLAQTVLDDDAVLVTDDIVFADKAAAAGYDGKVRQLVGSAPPG